MGTEADADALLAGARVLRAGDVLMREGEPSDDAYEVLSGTLEILRGRRQERIDTVGAGATVGEIAMLAGSLRSATVRALEPSVVRRIPHDHEALSSTEADEHYARLADLARERIDRHRLLALIGELLGVEPAAAAEISAMSQWMRLDPGETLFAAGDDSDAAYLVVSGRLAVVQEGQHIREVARGELVGEIGLIERVPRSATVVARRESTLARFDIDAFRRLTTTQPALMLEVSRTVLARLGRPDVAADRARSITVTVTADELDTRLTATRLANELARHGTTHHLWAARVDAALGRPGLVESGLPTTRPALAELLHEAETTHDYLLLETDPDVTQWTRTALSLGDRIIVVMSARADDDERARVASILAAVPSTSRVERWLALVHPADAERPSGATLADELGFERLAHVRAGSTADLGRLARLVSGNGTGLVLGGGGARGFAHIGAWRALRELGIEIDAIGGASIGAPLGVMMALEVDPEALERVIAGLFHGLLDYTVPVVSLLKGERIARNITTTLGDLDVRETWLPYFCVSTNLTRANVEIHDRASVATAVRASVAIPGVLPPVPVDGDLLVDGGVLNNLPCDVMRRTGTIRRLIAVDLSPPVGPRAGDDYGLSASGWRALRSSLGRSSRSQFPGIVAIIMRAMVAGSMRDRDQMLADGTIDCYLDLDLRGVQLLEFERVAEIAARGYDAAFPRLAAWRDEHLVGQEASAATP